MNGLQKEAFHQDRFLCGRAPRDSQPLAETTNLQGASMNSANKLLLTCLGLGAGLALSLTSCSGEPQNGGQGANNAAPAQNQNQNQAKGQEEAAPPKDAGKAIGEFPEVDIETAEMTPVYAHEEGDIPTYAVELKDGHFNPRVIVVPQKTKFRLRITNTGTKPCEFESLSLRKEKPLYMNSTSSIVIIPLEKGKYDMFDDFTNGHPGYIVAK